MFGELVIALLGAESLVAVGYLMGKLSFQRVHHYNIQIKVLLSDTLIAFAAIIAINFFAALFEFDYLLASILMKIALSLMLYSAVHLGTIATIFYVKPKRPHMKGILKEVLWEKPFSPFIIYLLFLSLAIFYVWLIPNRVKIVPDIILGKLTVVPAFEQVEVIFLSLCFVAFWAYSCTFFLLASEGYKDKRMGNKMKNFAYCSLSLFLPVFIFNVLYWHIGISASGVIFLFWIPSFAKIIEVFSKANSLEDLFKEDTKEYVQSCFRILKQNRRPSHDKTHK